MKKKNRKQMEYEYEYMLKKHTSDIEELYPQVVRIDCKFLFKDPDHLAADFTRDYTFMPKEKAWFIIKCPNRECVGGGLKLEWEIKEMIQKRETSKKGMVTCQGWSDEERINQYRCLYEMHYDITVEYKNI